MLDVLTTHELANVINACHVWVCFQGEKAIHLGIQMIFVMVASR